MQSVPAHLLNQVRDADSLQVPHGGQTTQVSPLLQDIRQRLLPVPAPADPPGDQTLSLLLLRELVPSAVTPAAAHQVGPAVNTKQGMSGWCGVKLKATLQLSTTEILHLMVIDYKFLQHFEIFIYFIFFVENLSAFIPSQFRHIFWRILIKSWLDMPLIVHVFDASRLWLN